MPTHTRVAIIGSGPTGYTAGLYAARASLQPTLFAGEKSGGQLMFTTDIENFPGFPKGKSGPELMIDMRAQAERFGTFMVDQYVTAVDFSAKPFKIWTNFPTNQTAQVLERGSVEALEAFRTAVMQAEPSYTADAVILAVGAKSKPLDVPGEDSFMGRGVSVCAVCDAAFYREKDTIVVGAGDTAMEDTLALTKFARSVTVLVRSAQMRASKVMQDRVRSHPKVKILYNTVITEVLGDQQVTSVKLRDTATNVESTLPIHGVFIAIGHAPMTGFLAGQVALDAHGSIITRQSPTAAGVAAAQAVLDEQGRVAFPTMTSVEGVFAGGDAVDPRYWQAITAAGQGCAAAIDAERWLEKR